MTEGKRRASIAVGAALAACTVAQMGCGQKAERAAIVNVTPGSAFTDGPVFLRVDTLNVRPQLDIDVAAGSLATRLASLKVTLVPDSEDGRPRVPVEIVKWTPLSGQQSYWVKTPAGLADGSYGIELVDASGTKTSRPQAFDALGLDTGKPEITATAFSGGIDLTDGSAASGSSIEVAIMVDDHMGGLASVDWKTSDGTTVGSCLPPPDDPTDPPPSRVPDCRALFKAPQLSDQDPTIAAFTFTVTATDIAGNTRIVELPLVVAKAPIIDSFSESEGSLVGEQEFTVNGQYFLGTNTKALIGDPPIEILGVAILNEHTIVGRTPPHARAESVPVQVKSLGGTAVAKMLFTYLPPPRPRDIQPSHGPASGGIRVTVVGNDFRPDVAIYVGGTPDNSGKFDSRHQLYNVIRDPSQTNKVTGCLPPGTETGTETVSVWASGSVSGNSELPNAFTYQTDAGGGGGAAGSTPDPDCLLMLP